jgi:hypothetical protein
LRKQIVKVGNKSEFASWNHASKGSFQEVQLTDDQFIIPGFVDTHIHAPQVPNIGLGLDLPLMDWLNVYTFPLETEYKDDAFAKHVYEKVVVSAKSYQNIGFGINIQSIPAPNSRRWHHNCLLLWNNPHKRLQDSR